MVSKPKPSPKADQNAGTARETHDLNVRRATRRPDAPVEEK